MYCRISKREWYDRGGLKNPNLWRRQRKGRGWEYFMTIDN